MNLSKAMQGFYFIGFSDESVLNKDSIEVYKEAIKREQSENGSN
jgi:hypothetical protein